MLLSILFFIFILMYWIGEGVTEGYTWADAKRRYENKLVHPNHANNGLMDYHAWRIVEVLGIVGACLTGMAGGLALFQVGVSAYFIGITLYGFALNHVDNGTIYKDPSWRYHLLGHDLPSLSAGKRIWTFLIAGVIILFL